MSDFPPPPGSDVPPPPPPPPPPPRPYVAQDPPAGYTATYGAPSTAPSEPAGVGARLGALVIDWVVTLVFWAPVAVALAVGPTRLTACSVDGDGNVTIGQEINSICEVPTNDTIAVAVVLGVLALVATLAYFVVPVGRHGQTLGKRAVGVRVVDASTGGPIGGGRALGRWLFAALISSNVCLLGYLWAIWDDRKQTWHDKVVSSVVIRG